MKFWTLAAATAMLAAVTTHTASAQTASRYSGTGVKSSVAAHALPRSTSVRNKAYHSAVPAPPRVPLRSSRRWASSRKNSLGMIGIDETGRMDRSGKSVGFYPSIRGTVKVGPHPSASRQTNGSSAPRENAQKDPFKHAPK